MIRWFQSFIWILAWFRHFCHSQSQKTPFHSVTLDWCCYRRPSSFSCRIKRPCSHWNSWFYPLKFWHTPRNIYPAIKCTQVQRFDMYFHSQPGILPTTSHFDVFFIIMIDKMSVQKVIFWKCFTISNHEQFVSRLVVGVFHYLFCNWSRNYQLLTLSEQKHKKGYFDGCV